MNGNRKHLVSIFAICVTAFSFSGSIANAATIGIGVNFDGGPDAGTPSPLALTDVAGVVPLANWNNAATKSGTSSALIDSNGNVTGAKVTWSSGNTYTNGNNVGSTDPNDALLGNYLDGGSGGTATVTVTNVPYSKYNLIIYTQRDGNATSDYTVNGGTTQTVQVAGSGFYNANGFVQDTATITGDYLEFTGLTSSTLSILASQINSRSPVDGIQIINTSTPEPSTTAALVGMGCVGLVGFALRRRRKA